ncbi:zinc finger protein, partial [Clarias magur]
DSEYTRDNDVLVLQRHAHGITCIKTRKQIQDSEWQRGKMFCYKSSPAPFVQFHTPLDLTTNSSRDGAASERLQIPGEIKSENVSQKGRMFCYKSSPAPFVQFHTPLDLSTDSSKDGTASERLQIPVEIKSENVSLQRGGPDMWGEKGRFDYTERS